MQGSPLASHYASIATSARQGNDGGILATYSQTRFAQELQALFAHLEDHELLDALRPKTGRPGYPVEMMWRTYIAGYYLNIPTFASLIRELHRNPCLAYLCGIQALQEVPTKYAYCRFLKKLLVHRNLVERCTVRIVQKLQRALPGFGKTIAIDSTPVHAYSRPRKAMVSDPEAAWGYEKDRYGRPFKFYGYKVHLVADATHQLPLAIEVRPANNADSIVAPQLLTRMKVDLAYIQPRYIVGDAGYDSQAVYAAALSMKAAPIIKLNPRCRVSVPRGQGYRLYPKVSLDPKRWQRLYNRRTSVERCFSLLKGYRKLDNLKLRGLRKVEMHALLGLLVIQATALVAAQVHKGIGLRRVI